MSKYRRLKSKHRCSANIDVYRPSLDQEASGKVKNNLVIPCMFTVLYVVAYDQGVEKFLYDTV
jgi:hypothetical protein